MTAATVPVAGCVLAAGAGRRMGSPKADLLLDGVRLVDRAAAALAAGGCVPVRAVVRAGTTVAGAEVVPNPDPESGMRSSLVLAVAAARDDPALAVLLVDLPGVDAAAVRAVVAAWQPGRITLGRYTDGVGHPIVMSPAFWAAALGLAGPDEGARAFLRAHPELVDVVDVAGSALDLDTPGDLRRWSAH